MGVAHALLRAVSALLPRPLESNNIDKRSENRLTDERALGTIMGVAHALLRAVSALLPRPLESNNIDKRPENPLTHERALGTIMGCDSWR